MGAQLDALNLVHRVALLSDVGTEAALVDVRLHVRQT
jgi:hypothetical protein